MDRLSRISIKTHAKWILTGEHAIVNGHAALVFPLHNKTLALDFYPDSSSSLHDKSPGKLDLKPIVNKIIEHIHQSIHHSKNRLSGKIEICNHIPVGAGLGFSAALCVAFCRLLINLSLLEEKDIFPFAKHMEDIFHGKSSGVDILGVLSKQGLFYQPGQETIPINLQWKPYLCLSFTNSNCRTSECIAKVQQLRTEQPQYAKQIDNDMEQSALMARKALESSQTEGQQLLKKAIDLGLHCFDSWGLVTDSIKKNIEHLKAHNAYAVKPIGSGGGGYILSMWETPPPPNLTGLMKVTF